MVAHFIISGHNGGPPAFEGLEDLEDLEASPVPKSTPEAESAEDLDPFNIQSSISDESFSKQQDEDSRDIPVHATGLEMPVEEKVVPSPGFAEMENISFEIDLEEPESGNDLPDQEIDRESLVVAPESAGDAHDERMQSSADACALASPVLYVPPVKASQKQFS